MSGVAKVFLVINLVLTIIFLGTSATLFSVRKDWKEASVKLDVDYAKKFSEQSDQVKELAQKVRTWTDLLSVQNAEILSLRADNKTMSGQLAKAEADLSTTRTELAKKVATLEERGTELANLSAQVESLSKQFEAATKAAQEANQNARIAVGDKDEIFLQLAQRTEELDAALKELKSLREENEHLKIQQLIIGKGLDPSKAGVPEIEGHVMAVSERHVVLSVGTDDKVVPGMIFAISRGSNYLGDVRVRTLYKDQAGAEIIYQVPNAKIQEGDNAKPKRI